MKINMFSSHRSAKASRQGGFTLIELLVVIAIISILAAFAVPALTSALKKGQMTGTLNNARQLYLAQFQMSNDGAASGDAGSAWPGDLIAATLLNPVTLNGYTDYLIAKGYLQGGDVLKLLNAPGSSLTGNYAAGPPATVTFTGGSGALKVYPVLDADPVSAIFCVSNNYVYDTAIVSGAVPYGTNGFIVVHKGGDAIIFKEGQAVDAPPAWPDDITFQTQVGFKTGDTYGAAPTVGDPANVLTYP